MKSILKSLKQSARSMAVTVAAVFLMAAIFARRFPLQAPPLQAPLVTSLA